MDMTGTMVCKRYGDSVRPKKHIKDSGSDFSSTVMWLTSELLKMFVTDPVTM